MPNAPASLADYEFSRLRGHAIALKILDHRADASDRAEWTSRLKADLTSALSRATVRVDPSASTTLDVWLLSARADFELAQWKGCTRLSAELSALPTVAGTIKVSSDRCVTKENLFGYATANRVLMQAYQNALAELLSNLDRELR